jgi:hypothetical protein
MNVRILCSAICVVFLHPLSARAENLESAYTDIVLSKCEVIKHESDDPDADEGSEDVWKCKGYGEIPVVVRYGHVRMYVSYGANAENATAAGQTLGPSNAVMEKVKGLEWRLSDASGKPEPFATIIRFHWTIDPNDVGETLIVTKLEPNNSCHVAYIAATGNPKANEQARAIADKDARNFDCSKEPTTYDKDGKVRHVP